jgi:hypothetical protein
VQIRTRRKRSASSPLGSETNFGRLPRRGWCGPRSTKKKKADDGDSAKGKSDEKIGLRYATEKEAGTLAVPQWLPRGSMVKIHTEHGVLAYIAADEGPSVEARHAAKESGKTEEQMAASVLDFCAAEQLWPDFVIVEIYYYAGKVPFNELSIDEQRTLFAYAMEYVTKRE